MGDNWIFKKRYYRFCKTFSNPSVLYVISMNFGKKKTNILKEVWYISYGFYGTVLSCKLRLQTSNKIGNL